MAVRPPVAPRARGASPARRRPVQPHLGAARDSPIGARPGRRDDPRRARVAIPLGRGGDTPPTGARGEWQCARVYAVLGRGRAGTPPRPALPGACARSTSSATGTSPPRGRRSRGRRAWPGTEAAYRRRWREAGRRSTGSPTPRTGGSSRRTWTSSRAPPPDELQGHHVGTPPTTPRTMPDEQHPERDVGTPRHEQRGGRREEHHRDALTTVRPTRPTFWWSVTTIGLSSAARP